jgi:hypothetical protein
MRCCRSSFRSARSATILQRFGRYPAEPASLFGISPIEAGRQAIDRANRAVDAKGRKLRCDGVAFIAGVVSYPIDKRVVDGMIGDADYYCFWRHEVVEWLKGQFGQNLLSVVEHSEERFLHLHFYCVPQLDDAMRLDLGAIHPGRAAKSQAAAAGKTKRDQDAAYRAGMRRFQDHFHEDVSSKFGHDRYGPRRQRVSRKEQLMRRDLEKERAQLREVSEREIAQVAAEANADANDRYRSRIRRLQASHDEERRLRLFAEQELAEIRAELAEFTASQGMSV